MRKKFNDTGLCIPEKHFMADTSAKLSQIIELVEEGAYFTINRPRQYGKTTSIHSLFLALNNGYPYLVSKLSKFVDEDILPQKGVQQWDKADTEAAFKRITYGGYTTTLFDSMTKYLEDDSDLFDMVFDLAINGASYDFNINAPVVNTAAIYGIIRDDHGMCRIHNRVFEQRLYGYFLAKQATENMLWS